MAKNKTKEALENVAPEIEPVEVPAAEATAPVEDAPAEPIVEEGQGSVEEVLTEPAADLSVLPVQAIDYLKRHTEVDAIYIDKFGGMFPKDTPQVFAKDAILYHNPYFKP